MDLTAFAQSFNHTGFILSISGASTVDLLASLRVFSCLEFSVSLFDLTKAGSLMSLRGCVCVGPFALFVGVSCLDLAFFLPVPDFLHLDLLLFLQSLARVGFLAFVLETSCFDFSVPTRSIARTALPLLSLNIAYSGLSLSLQSFTRFGFSMSVFGNVWIGSCFSLFVVDAINLGFSSFLRSFCCPDPCSPAMDFLHLESLILLQSFASTESALSAVCFSHPDLFTFLHSFTCPGPFLLICGIS